MEKWLTLRLGQGKYKMSQEQEHRTFFYYIKLNKQIKKKTLYRCMSKGYRSQLKELSMAKFETI